MAYSSIGLVLVYITFTVVFKICHFFCQQRICTLSEVKFNSPEAKNTFCKHEINKTDDQQDHIHCRDDQQDLMHCRDDF